MNEQRPAARGSRFFAYGAILIAALVVLSFPITYFIPLATGTKQFTLLRHLHGLAFFAWIALYVVQTRLVRTGNVRLHRELGIVGVALVGAMLPLGLWQAVSAIAERQTKGVALPFEFAIYNLVDISVFALAFGWAVFEASRRIEWHRRLMFIAALNLFGPAFSRVTFLVPLPFPWFDMAPNLVADALLIALALHDRRKLGRIHPVTLGAALVLIPFHGIEPLIARSAWWNAIAPVLFGFS
ncbi:MAG: adenylate cyclase [Novosphingobium sp.]